MSAYDQDDEVLLQKLREEARAQFLQRRSRQLLDNTELKELWVILDQHSSPAGDEQMMSYGQFKTVAGLVTDKCKSYFSPVVFAKLQQGDR